MALTRGLLRFRLSFCTRSTDPVWTRQPQYARCGVLVRGFASPPTSQDTEPAAADVEQNERAQWTPESRRTGAIAVKLGMTQMWNDQGHPVPITVLQVAAYESVLMNIHEPPPPQVLDNQVVNVRTKDKEGYWGLQVGGINHPKPKNVRNLSLKLGGPLRNWLTSLTPRPPSLSSPYLSNVSPNLAVAKAGTWSVPKS